MDVASIILNRLCLFIFIENITEFRYNNSMTFKRLLLNHNISGYSLSKATHIPYMTINDLINGKTKVENISLKHAYEISKCLDIEITDLLKIDTVSLPQFRYFRNNILMELKLFGYETFISSVIKNKQIDYYYKNNGKEYALYLLALIDYLCRINNLPLYFERYNSLRKQRLKKAYFVGSDVIKFDSIEDAEKQLKIEIIPEFKKYNIIEENISNVA